MRILFNYLSVAAIAIGILVTVSCEKEESAAAPVASFTTSVDDKTVTFTNTSTNATSYEWDFGDNSGTSTEENPVYTYDAYADYDVRLTAIGDGGQVTQKQTISVIQEWPAITIDGDFSDWDAVESFYSGYADASGNLTEAKITSESSNTKLYVYVKGDLSVANHVVQIMIDADGDASTGWNRDGDYAPDACGAEYQYEYYIQPGPAWAGLYGWDDQEANQGWPWIIDLTTDGDNGMITESSGVVGDAEVEFVIELTQMISPAVSNEQIGVFFWAQNTDWNQVGQLPPNLADPLESVKKFSFQ